MESSLLEQGLSTQQFYEIIGYIASFLVAISLMMKSILRLRLINLAGAIAFTIYGVLIGAAPVAIVNAFIILINLFYLRRMLVARGRDYFETLEMALDEPYLIRFLEHHQADIQRFMPEFELTDIQAKLDSVRGEGGHSGKAPQTGALWPRAVFVLRDMVPAGLVIYAQLPPETGPGIELLLDYAIPGYRDRRTGRFVHGEDGLFDALRPLPERVMSRASVPAHAQYLESMGFEAENGTDRWWNTLQD